ncbi:hypothetical protein KQI52_13525 [bacterium]|nr:hypothetical protein [bacterium]
MRTYAPNRIRTFALLTVWLVAGVILNMAVPCEGSGLPVANTPDRKSTVSDTSGRFFRSQNEGKNVTSGVTGFSDSTASASASGHGHTLFDLTPLPELSGIPAKPKLGQIIAVDFHPESGFLALENGNQRLLRFDRRGVFIGEAGGFGFGDGSLRGATDITRAGFEIWVCDPLAARIVRYDTRLAPLEPWTSVVEQAQDVSFSRPVSIARAASGDAVLIEQDRAEAWLIDAGGRLVERIGAFGEMDESFGDPHRVAVAPDGKLAVADPAQRTVFLFDRFGTPRGRRPWTGDTPGPMTVTWLNDSLFVAGPELLRLLDPRGQTVREWTALDLGEGAIHDLACDGDRLLVAQGTSVRRFTFERNQSRP